MVVAEQRPVQGTLESVYALLFGTSALVCFLHNDSGHGTMWAVIGLLFLTLSLRRAAE